MCTATPLWQGTFHWTYFFIWFKHNAICDCLLNYLEVICILYSKGFFCSTGLYYKQIRRNPVYNMIFSTWSSVRTLFQFVNLRVEDKSYNHKSRWWRQEKQPCRQTKQLSYFTTEYFLTTGLATCHSTAATYHFYIPVQGLRPLTACILGLPINQVS